MTGPVLTKQQMSAVTDRGGALLVSAAAGSGKTKVLVERLLGYITDSDRPADMTDFLIITYTRAAAAELKSRILEEISKRLAQTPDNRHLRRQSALGYQAHIGTIHGFCADIIRENAHLLDISPDFRVADEKESTLMKRQTLEALLEKRYETIAESDSFAQLVDTMAAGRDDRRLQEIVLDTHAKLMSHPDPAGWIAGEQARLDTLDRGGANDVSETVWGRLLMDGARRAAEYWRGAISGLLAETGGCADFIAAYGDSLAATEESLGRFIDALGIGWDEAREAAAIDFPRAKNVKGYEEYKDLRTRCKDAMKKVAALFECSSGEHMEDMLAVRPAVGELLKLVGEFDEAYAALKKKRGVIDFADQEHMAARLLADLKTGAPTTLGRAVSARFTEIMVDEYQDVNAVQELIFGAVSREGRNLFMVGDVRQSIYRFRLADPTIFLRKYKAYRDADGTADGEGRRILLSTNFRSRPGILDAVNFVFKNIMSEDFGEMTYTEREFLYAGRAESHPDDPAVELDVIDIHSDDTSEEEESPEKTAVEAAFVAGRIRELVDGGYMLPDGEGGCRKAGYGDIVILLRSMKDRAPVFASALTAAGIPVGLAGGEGFTETLEVSVMLAFLDIVDNPRQDIPLTTVLKSPVYGFTPDELSEIRIADKNGDFYTALTKAAETSIKCRAFLDELGALRALSADLSVDKLIWHIYTVTGMLGVMGALPDGKTRRGNLMLLLDFAEHFESGGYRGVFDFVGFMRRLRENGDEPVERADAYSPDAVRIMSIHKSKGLEFPIVFLADTTKQLNLQDTRKPLLIHAQLGVGAKRTDLDRRIEYPTLPRLAVAGQLKREASAEELRVLYVAMTRAREKLIITAAFPDASKALEKFKKDAGTPAAPQALENVKSMAGFILLPALTRPEAAALSGEAMSEPSGGETPWFMRRIAASEIGGKTVSRAAAPDVGNKSKPESDTAGLEAYFSFRYPYEKAVSLPSKVTATELKGRFADLEAAEEARPFGYGTGGDTDTRNGAGKRSEPYDRPNFITQRSGLTAPERGTALHLAMQYVEYGKCVTKEGVAGELERLRDRHLLTAAQAAAVDPEKISRFFSSELGRRVLTAGKLRREFKFSLLMKAEDIERGAGDDDILFQGVVDCCFEENGALTVVDFKTDYVTEETLEEKKRVYAPQLDAYARAMERITGLPVKSRLLYFFSAGLASEV